MKEHIDSSSFCHYCNKEIDPKRFESVFISHIHYKSQDCSECGRNIRVVVDFEGSGHDTWKGNKPFAPKKEKSPVRIRTLEDKIQVLGEVKQ